MEIPGHVSVEINNYGPTAVTIVRLPEHEVESDMELHLRNAIGEACEKKRGFQLDLEHRLRSMRS
jgi:hypothetical protein